MGAEAGIMLFGVWGSQGLAGSGGGAAWLPREAAPQRRTHGQVEAGKYRGPSRRKERAVQDDKT